MKLRIMSFNVLCGGLADDFWTFRCEDLVNLIKKYEPDVFGVQEATPEWMDYFRENLPAWTAVGKARDGENIGEYSAVLYRNSKFKEIESGTFWLSETPEKVSLGWDAACKRVCTYVTLQSKRGKQFAMLNTHLDHVGHMAQKNGAAMVKKKLTSYQIPAILTGDFNVAEDSDVYKSMPDEKVGNAKYLTKNSEAANTFNDFGRRPEDKPFVIDHCFVLKKKMKILSYKVITDKRPNGRYISDHYPILAVAEF